MKYRSVSPSSPSANYHWLTHPFCCFAVCATMTNSRQSQSRFCHASHPNAIVISLLAPYHDNLASSPLPPADGVVATSLGIHSWCQQYWQAVASRIECGNYSSPGLVFARVLKAVAGE